MSEVLFTPRGIPYRGPIREFNIAWDHLGDCPKCGRLTGESCVMTFRGKAFERITPHPERYEPAPAAVSVDAGEPANPATHDRREYPIGPWSPIGQSCRNDLARCGSCYCGKLRREAEPEPEPQARTWFQIASGEPSCEHVTGCREPQTPGDIYGLCVGHSKQVWTRDGVQR